MQEQTKTLQNSLNSEFLNLIPQPKSIQVEGCGCILSNIKTIRYSGDEDGALEALCMRFPGMAVSREEDGFFVELSMGKPLSKLECPNQPDAYVLSVTAKGVRIDADSATGLFYGIQTLLQLPDSVPGVRITDYASIPMRMIHWDLKGYLPHFEVILEEMNILASYKVNAILLELEDKYDFKSAPGVGVKGAYIYEQMRQLSVYAKSLHIQIIPKLQSIAHVDYILKHEAYKHLRENGRVYEYCATNQEAQKLWEAMCLELMDCFAEHKQYFHIGADESRFMGECPECSKLGKAKAYAHKVGTCIDFVREQGWTPVMWDDIIRNDRKTFSPAEELEVRERLGNHAVIMYWSYGYGGKNNVFPYIEEFQSTGMQVWGASGYAGCDNWAGSVAPMAKRALNIDAWTKAAVEHNIGCVCATGWTRIGSADCPAEPQEGCWFTILYAAASMWSGEAYDYKEFIRALAKRFYGTDIEENLVDAIMDVSQNPYPFTEAEKSVGGSDRLTFLKYAIAMEYFVAWILNRVVHQYQYYDGKLGNKFEDHRRRDWLSYARDELPVDIKRYKSKLSGIYSVFYKGVTVDEIIQSRFAFLEKFLAELVRILENTQEF